MKIGVNANLMQSTDGYGKAGIGRYQIRLIEGLQRVDRTNEYCVFVDPGFHVPDAWKTSENFEFIPTHRVIGRRKLVWTKFVAPLEITRRKIDVWFCLQAILPSMCPVKCATVIHDLAPIRHPELFTPRHVRITKSTIFNTMRRADLIFCDSAYTLNEVAAYVPSRQKLVLNTLGAGNAIERVDPASVSADALKAMGVRSPRYFFVLSTVEPRKNLPRLVTAFARLAQDPEFSDTNLVIAGARGWKNSALFETIERLSIANRIDFLGYVPDEQLSALFAGSRAFVCASITEGFGIPLLEAMMAGAPIISSRGGSLPEVGGDLPIYFDPLDSDDIVRAMREQAHDTRDRTELIEAGIRRSRLYTWDATCKTVMDNLVRLGASG